MSIRLKYEMSLPNITFIDIHGYYLSPKLGKHPGYGQKAITCLQMELISRLTVLLQIISWTRKLFP